MSVEIKKEERPELAPSAPIKLTTMGNVVELQYMSKRNDKATILMLEGGQQYVDLSTGEVKDVKHANNRAELYKSLYRTFRRLRALINTNVTDINNCRWLTLTYADNMQDAKQLYKDCKGFYRRLSYRLAKMQIDKPEYITVCEPQGRGAWHCHILLIWQHKAPYIHNDVIAKAWGHGYTKTTALDKCDNLGAYLTAYLGDMDVTAVMRDNPNEVQRLLEGRAEIKSVEQDGQTKYYVKGARLSLYPPKFNLYRCSKGIQEPETVYTTLERAEKKVSAGTLTFEKTVHVTDTDSRYDTVIHTRQYNMVRR